MLLPASSAFLHLGLIFLSLKVFESVDFVLGFFNRLFERFGFGLF